MQNPVGQATTVWKYTVTVDKPVTVIEMPIHARIVHVAPHPNEAAAVDFWAEVQVPAAAMVNRAFSVIGTGHPMTADEFEYVGTAPHRIGLVWHLYEVVEPHVTSDEVDFRG
jgi:hypothetical protein